ncbi:unnamed protein product [Cyclocybe aegerita]|uniref:Uncharacterized protein n=1 Tax=Cyclocybe aegerita TaxID=1973307 RepID=A0A8S0VQQ8_CYCAE|nr:unnamed protein product [Cyclocybe aegerita]
MAQDPRDKAGTTTKKAKKSSTSGKKAAAAALKSRATNGNKKPLPLKLKIPPQTSEKDMAEESPPITPPPKVSVSKDELDKAMVELLGHDHTSECAWTSSRGSKSPGVNATSNFDDGGYKQKRAASDSSLDGESKADSDSSVEMVAMDNMEEEVDELIDDKSDDQEAEEELEEEIVLLPFSIPYEGANTTVEFAADIDWPTFISNLADTLSIAPKDVKVAYKFSVLAQGVAWTHLRCDKDLWVLFEKALTAMEKQKKNRSVKEFEVVLKDLRVDVKASKKEPEKKKASKKKVDSSDSDNSTPDLQKTSKSKKSSTQWVTLLMKDNACIEHSGQACLKFASRHYQLTKSDLGAWAVFMAQGYESTTIPPKSLKIGDSDRVGKPKTPAAQGAPHADPAPATPAPATPAPAMQLPPNHYGAGYYQTPFPPMPYPMFIPPTPAAPGWPPNAQSPYQLMRGSHGLDNFPSSDPPEVVEDITLFPRIANWLQRLDDGPLGGDGHNFSQFAPFFEAEMYVRISDIADNLTTESLRVTCPTMAHGTTSHIISRAKADTKAIWREEVRRLRENAHRPQHYI